MTEVTPTQRRLTIAAAVIFAVMFGIELVGWLGFVPDETATGADVILYGTLALGLVLNTLRRRSRLVNLATWIAFGSAIAAGISRW